MDLTRLTPDQTQLLRHVIPIIVLNFERAGYDLTRDWIPYTYQVAATSGVFGAGARVTEHGETSLPGLFAAGTCSDMAYLPGGHLSFVSTSGQWAGEGVIAWLSERPEAPAWDAVHGHAAALAQRAVAPLRQPGDLGHAEARARLGRILTEDVGFVMRADRLARALGKARAVAAEDLGRLRARDAHDLAKVWGVIHYTEVLEAILTAYHYRRESRVAFLREDYPDIDNESWLRIVLVQRRDGGLHVWDEPIPPSFHLTPPRRTKRRHMAFRVSDAQD
jgi:succinate dehydrogenase/fumarate reductase flavoprotein subunit